MKVNRIRVRKMDRINTNVKIHTPKIQKEKYRFNWRKEIEDELDEKKFGGLLW